MQLVKLNVSVLIFMGYFCCVFCEYQLQCEPGEGNSFEYGTGTEVCRICASFTVGIEQNGPQLCEWCNMGSIPIGGQWMGRDGV